ncbi:hypothetical protein GOP47_0006382 [Adiantum capillus-veneris]|uniref:Uncharacterized protein n=1 Tax=Adiantum capillus-veneris TaxID=13818 RepID=A0A9D4V3H4_ADICA|nr:hypothetical protein GOP47_0006382 [Adiantum capillus-veneris]
MTGISKSSKVGHLASFSVVHQAPCATHGQICIAPFHRLLVAELPTIRLALCSRPRVLASIKGMVLKRIQISGPRCFLGVNFLNPALPSSWAYFRSLSWAASTPSALEDFAFPRPSLAARTIFPFNCYQEGIA